MTTVTPRILAEVAAPDPDIIDPTDPPEAWLPEPWTWWRVEWARTQTIHPDAAVPDGWRIVGTREVKTTQRTHFAGATLITLTPELWPTIAPQRAIYGGDDIREGRGMVGLGVHTSADYWCRADLWIARAPAGTPLPDGWTHVPRPDGEPTKTGIWLPWIAPPGLDERRAGSIWVDWMHLSTELTVATARQQPTGRWSAGTGSWGHHTTMPGTHATAGEALDAAEAAITADRAAVDERWNLRNWCHADLDAPIIRRNLTLEP